VGSLQVRFRETFTTQFQYQGVVDPCRLQDITTRMHQSLAALGHNMDQVKALAQGAAGAAQGAASAQGSGQGLLTEMEDRVAGMEGRLLGPRHFLRDLLAPEAAEGLFRQELRAAAGQLRRRLDKSLGADQVTAVLSQEDDPFSLARGQGLLEQADLLRLATCLGQVQPHTVRLTRTVQAIGQDIERAHRVPAENAGTFRSATARLYLLSCLPLLGLFPALALRRRVEAYQSAFRSTLPVYRALGAETLARNHTYRAVTLVANFPAALVLAQVGRRLESYLGPASGQPAADGLVRVE
jgi:hypothetical protein